MEKIKSTLFVFFIICIVPVFAACNVSSTHIPALYTVVSPTAVNLSTPATTQVVSTEPIIITPDQTPSSNDPILPTTQEFPTSTTTPQPQDTPTVQEQENLDFAYWNAKNVHLVFRAYNLKVGNLRTLDKNEFPEDAWFTDEAFFLDLTSSCRECWARLFFFDSPEQLQKSYDYHLQVNLEDPEQTNWLFIDHNLLLQLNSKVKESLAEKFLFALQNYLPASMLQPSTFPNSFYESWDEYYPMDRGQQVDPANGLGQRTYNRWEGKNYWQFGQSTWRYQDPNGSTNPPPYYPATFEGEPLSYYIHYHCEEQINSNPSLDCLNWRMFIELMTMTKENTELHNWARGGWQWKKPKPITWEVYYHPTAFNGMCDRRYILDNVSTQELQDASIKFPLIVRLPKTTGVRYISPRYCSIFFRSYTLLTNSIVAVNLAQNTTETLEKIYDPVNDQYLIKAINRYYVYDTTIDGEVIFRQEEYEIYWSRQTKADNQLRNGMEAFWWFTWKTPPDENRDVDVDPSWSAFQWCFQDLSQPPEWLGKLTCRQ